jgi:hypothetical protein
MALTGRPPLARSEDMGRLRKLAEVPARSARREMA